MPPELQSGQNIEARTTLGYVNKLTCIAVRAKRKGNVEIREDEQILILKYVLVMIDKKK